MADERMEEVVEAWYMHLDFPRTGIVFEVTANKKRITPVIINSGYIGKSQIYDLSPEEKRLMSNLKYLKNKLEQWQ